MPADEKSEWSLVDFARQVAGALKVDFDSIEPAPVSEKLPSAPAATDKINMAPEGPQVATEKLDPAPTELQNPQPGGTKEVMASHQASGGRKQLRTSDEIAKMILATLRAIDSCPERGLVVTVYGSNPWNAMLTIRPEAGLAIDRSLWLSRVQEIGVRLRDDFDIIQETKASTDGVRQEVTDLGGAARLPSPEAEGT